MNAHHHNDRDRDDFHRVYGSGELLSWHEYDNDCVCDVSDGGGGYYVPWQEHQPIQTASMQGIVSLVSGFDLIIQKKGCQSSTPVSVFQLSSLFSFLTRCSAYSSILSG